MRALNIICGIAILIAAVHLVHGVHHFYGHAVHDGMSGTGLWGGIGGATLMLVLCVIGAIQLFRRPN